MKMVTAVILLSTVLSVVLSNNEPTSSLVAWANFKKNFNKTYASPEEDLKRMKIFLANEETVKKHNERYKTGQSTYFLATNKFSDMTDDEFAKKYSRKGSISWRRTKKTQDDRSDDEYFVPNTTATLPDTVDWRKRGDNSPVHGQLDCGNCWSITTVASLEAAYAIKTGKSVLLSVQELNDCSKEGENDACNGGWVDDAFSYVKANGLAGEEAYPRPFLQMAFEDCVRGSIPSSIELKGFLRIRPGREDDLKSAVATVGPVAVAFNVDELAWRQYKDGVLASETCSSRFADLNHGVLCVGYGTENGTDYWLLRNTWGEGWGLDGYIKVRRNAGNQCGIATEALFPVLP